MNEQTAFFDQLHDLIARDELDTALQQLRDVFEHAPDLNEIIHQSGRFQAIQKQIRLGTVSLAEANLTQNQIRNGVLNLISELKKQGEKPALRRELESAISIVHSKNVVVGSTISAGGNDTNRELESTISITDSKNIVVGSKISAGGDVHIGENHYHQTPEVKPILTKIPSEGTEKDFFGRAKELDELLGTFFPHLQKRTLWFFTKSLFSIFKKTPKSSEAKIFILSGEGGIGKTTLAARYFRLHMDKYRHTAWVPNETDIATALLKLAHPLNLKLEDLESDERLDELFRTLTGLPEPCLLVIDNLDDAEELGLCYSKLLTLINCHVILTTRVTAFVQTDFYRVQGLPQKDAFALFKKFHPALHAEDKKVFEQISAAVGDNTLVLELLAKNLAAVNKNKSKYTLTDLLEDLQQKGLLQLSHSSWIETLYRGRGKFRKEKPEDIIAAMYDLSELSDAEASLQAVFAMLPPLEAVPFDTLEHLFPDVENLEDCLAGLAQKGWLDFNPEIKTYQCNPLIREVLRDTKYNPALRQQCQKLVDALWQKLNPDTIYDGENYNYAPYHTWVAKLVRVFFANDLDYDMVLLCRRIGDYATMTGDLDTALTHFVEQKSLAEELVLNYPDDSSYKYERAIACQRLGSTHKALGNLPKALTFFENASSMTKELNESYPENVEFKNVLAISYSKLGSTHTALGNLPQALTFFEERSRLGKELHEAYPQNVEFKRNLSVSYDKLGRTHTELGNLPKALTFFEKALGLSIDLHEAYPENVSFKNDLAISYANLGKTHSELGNLPMALTFFENYNLLEKELHIAYPQNVLFKHGLAVSYGCLGDTHSALGNLPKALTFFEERSRLGKELHEAYPQNVDFKNDLAISYERLGDMRLKVGNLSKALTFFEERRRLAKELYDIYPENVVFKNSLAISYSKLGHMHSTLGDLPKSLTFFEQYNQLEKELLAAYPQTVDFKFNLADSYLSLGELHRDQRHDAESAKTYFQKGYELYAELVRDFPDYSSFRGNYEWAKEVLGMD
jgi:tetratricopeptide (TPR) repeat protein